jgi:hypothetical protein
MTFAKSYFLLLLLVLGCKTSGTQQESSELAADQVGRMPFCNNCSLEETRKYMSPLDAIGVSYSQYHYPKQAGDYQCMVENGIENVTFEFNVGLAGCNMKNFSIAGCPMLASLDQAITTAKEVKAGDGKSLHLDLWWQFNSGGAQEFKNRDAIIAGLKELTNKHPNAISRIWLQLDIGNATDRTVGYIRTEEYLRQLCGDGSVSCGIATTRVAWHSLYNAFLPPFSAQGVPLLEINFDFTPHRNRFFDIKNVPDRAKYWARESPDGKFIPYHGWLEPDAKRFYGTSGSEVGFDICKNGNKKLIPALGLHVIKRAALAKDYAPAFKISIVNKGNSVFPESVPDECRRVLKESAFQKILKNYSEKPNFNRLSHALARREAREVCREFNAMDGQSDRICFEDIQTLLVCDDDPAWVSCKSGCTVENNELGIGATCSDMTGNTVCGNTINLELSVEPVASSDNAENGENSGVLPAQGAPRRPIVDMSASIDAMADTAKPKSDQGITCPAGMRVSLNGQICYSAEEASIGGCQSNGLVLCPPQFAENIDAAMRGVSPVFAATNRGVQMVTDGSLRSNDFIMKLADSDAVVCPAGMAPSSDGSCYCINGNCPVNGRCTTDKAAEAKQYICSAEALGTAPPGTVCDNGRVPCSQGCCCSIKIVNQREVPMCGPNCNVPCTTYWGDVSATGDRAASGTLKCSYTPEKCRAMDPFMLPTANCNACWCTRYATNDNHPGSWCKQKQRPNMSFAHPIADKAPVVCAPGTVPRGEGKALYCSKDSDQEIRILWK